MKFHLGRIITFLVWGVLPTDLKAETLILKNGSTIKGTMTQMSSTEVTIDSPDVGLMVVKRGSIESIKSDVDTVTKPVGIATPTSEASPTSLTEGGGKQGQARSSSPSSLAGRLMVGASRFLVTKKKSLPSLHWEPIGYRFDFGLTLTALGDWSSGKAKIDNIDKFNFYHYGLGIGFATARPAPASSGGVFSIQGSFGKAQFSTTPVNEISYENRDYYRETPSRMFTIRRDGVKGDGIMFGFHGAYSYYLFEGTGVALGFSVLKGKMTRQYSESYVMDSSSGEYYSETGHHIDPNDTLNFSVSSIYTGMAYSF